MIPITKSHQPDVDNGRRSLSWVALITVGLLVGGCGALVERDGPGRARSPGNIKDAIPKAEPRSKYGNPDSYVVLGKRYHTLKTSAGFVERGVASWYGKKFHGRKTSSGEVYDMYKMTAAHKHLPLPTYVEVRRIDNGKKVIVKVNDRGPFHENRIIDLSYAAALKLGVAEAGTALVEVRAIDADGNVTRQASLPNGGSAQTGSGVYLQVGAFSKRGNADALAQKIASSITDRVRVRESSSTQGSLFKVQIGPVANVEFADVIVAGLRSLGISQHYFVNQ